MIRAILTLFAAMIGLLLAFPVLLVFLPLWVFSFVVNCMSSILSRGEASWKEILRFEPEIGWVPRSGLNVAYADRIGDRCSIRTDSEGCIGDRNFDECDMVVFGDSFAFGYGAKYEDAYFSRMNGVAVKAVGAPGYNMVQELLLMKRYARLIKGKMVIWFVCIENDLVENLRAYHSNYGYRMPFLRKSVETGTWRIVLDHVTEARWECGESKTYNSVLFSHLCKESSEYGKRVYSAAEYLIREGKNVCDDAGAQLVLFSIPYKLQLSGRGLRRLRGFLRDQDGFDAEYPEARLEKICEKFSVPFVRGASCLTLEDYKLRDGHWNRKGNRTVARILLSRYNGTFSHDSNTRG